MTSVESVDKKGVRNDGQNQVVVC